LPGAFGLASRPGAHEDGARRGPQASCADHPLGGPEVLDVVDLPDPTPSEGQKLYEVTAAGINYADTHNRLSADWPEG
jgi:hypothetical protein